MFPVCLASMPVDMWSPGQRILVGMYRTVCLSSECFFLCRHIFKCTCGNVCKHIDHVHSLYLMKHTAQLENTASDSSNQEKAFEAQEFSAEDTSSQDRDETRSEHSEPADTVPEVAIATEQEYSCTGLVYTN